MAVQFNQTNFKNQVATSITIEAIPDIEDLKISSLAEKGMDRKKKFLIREVNKLISEFNKLNEYLATTFMWDTANNKYSFQNVQAKVFRDKGLSLHRNYLLAYVHEANFNIQKTLGRLYYNRTKEFEKFLKSLEGRNALYITFNISKFRRGRLKKYKKDAEKAVVENFNSILSQVVKRYLKVKQVSRQEQLLAKFKDWKPKLSNPKNDKQKGFAQAIDSMVAIFSGKGKNLNLGEVKVLSDCFSKDRNWDTAWKEKMVKRYNPFPSLNDITNRVIIMLYGIVTDKGSNIDAMIQNYIN
ncbi:MAG: hypothetical protein Q4D57_05535 [Clostridia bacterium]|nr:hypothetical protein [Clostridia bacterium]